MINLYKLDTEKQNPATVMIDTCTTEQIIKLINNEDKKIASAIEKALPHIARAVDIITETLQNGGRLIYVGAGTSGRLGIMDAVECPPTFGTAPDLIQGLIAGGPEAIYCAKEGAEDNPDGGADDLKAVSLTDNDIVVGITASGRTPYVIGALIYASEIGAKTISLSCSNKAKVSQIASISIEVICGPEVITGSTRMKAGTAQKQVLNMLSTAAMIKIGKVYHNLMIDVKATNKKLLARAFSIVKQATGSDDLACQNALVAAKGSARTAIFMLITDLDYNQAVTILNNNKGHISKAIAAWNRGNND